MAVNAVPVYSTYKSISPARMAWWDTNEPPEPAAPDGGGIVRNAPPHTGGERQAGEEAPGGRGRPGEPQQLAISHAHSPTRLAHRRVHAGNPRVGVADDGEERVDDERGD